eukprot:TRINITY_DN9653_c0_g1_i1.p2 TRINITY_DN9653_c0_g1~~TRINITY_DN9653_c0_g1_i1.p2  ORF type:complete len:59 (+),score=5.49 TRINITY_DN9653_c0_g1_i1:327-503(+)
MRSQAKMERAIQDVTIAVLGGNDWLQSLSKNSLIIEPEGRLFWLGSFGETDKVMWDDF